MVFDAVPKYQMLPLHVDGAGTLLTCTSTAIHCYTDEEDAAGSQEPLLNLNYWNDEGLLPDAQRSSHLTANGNGGLNARLSKSATDLSLGNEDDCPSGALGVVSSSIRRREVGSSAGERGGVLESSRGSGTVGFTTDRMTVAHRTSSFFNMLKARFARSRSRERKSRKGGSGTSTVNWDGHEGGTPPGVRDTANVYPMDYEYNADNSSEPEASASSLSVTPASSPRHATCNRKALSGRGRLDSAAGCLKSIGGSLDVPGTPPPSQAVIVSSKELALRQHAFFQLNVILKQGHDLVAKDTCGTSDPYCKFKVGGRLLYKSKTVYRDLNPLWDEAFTLPIEDPFQPVQVKVFDYDWGLQDDFIGVTFIELTKLELNRPTELDLTLTDPGKSDNNGTLSMTVTLFPKTQEDKEQYFQRGAKLAEVQRRLKSQIWSCVVTVVLVEGRNLLPMDLDGSSDPYVKFRLGNEKYKSRVAFKTLSPSWLEQFDLHLYDEGSHELEVTVWDRDARTKDDFMGRCTVDLTQLEREKTHRLWTELEDNAGSLFLLLTISGTTAAETISDLASYAPDPRETQNLYARYGLLRPGPSFLKGAGIPSPLSTLRSFHNLRDVGHLTVKVFRAQGLVAADIGGKSDPFCVLELVNARLQTQTEYKTLTPNWQKIFTFNVKDINSVLEVTVYDEDRDHKVEFLGRIAIPLLKIHNGEKRWYALKDKKLWGRAKGNCPQILMEMSLVWNPIRACIRTVNPKEEKYMQTEIKFKRQVFLRNVLRVKAVIFSVIDTGKFVQSCFEWESTARSLTAFAVFLVMCYCFEPYMLPVALLLIFMKNYLVLAITGGRQHREEEETLASEEEDDDDDKDKEEKKSLKDRLQAIQEVTQTVQNTIGYIASLCESVANTFNFTVPFLSWLAVVAMVMVAFLLYLMPVRYLVMLWGANKFMRKLVFPHTVPNNEILDFISRVPDDEQLIMYRELKTLQTPESSERRRDQQQRKKKT